MPGNEKSICVVHWCNVWLNVTENWLYDQIHYLPDYVKSHIFCRDLKNDDKYKLPNIRWFPPHNGENYFNKCLSKIGCLPRNKNLFKNAGRLGAQLLHSHYGFAGWMNITAARKLGLKHVVTFYGLDVSRFPQTYPVWKKRYFRMFSLIDCVLCEGTHMARSVRALGCPEEKVRVHHLGIRTDEIKFVPRKFSSNQPLRVLIAASFREKKGIPYALEALGRLSQKISLQVTVIGDAGDDPHTENEKKKILNVIDKYKMNSRINLLGYQPHTELLKQAYLSHIFLSPSITAADGDTEGGAPVGIIEMAATGMPVVSTKHCDIPEVLGDGEYDLLAQEKDIEGLVTHLTWLYYNPNRWNAMVTKARKHIESQYNSKNQGKKLAEIYKQLLDDH